jgi:cyanophycinase
LKSNHHVLIGALLFLFGHYAHSAPTHVLLFGGGEYSAPGLERFVSLAGGAKQANLLIITWASDETAVAANRLAKALRPWHPKTIEVAPAATELATKKNHLLNQLARATGVFFTGGEQDLIMKQFEDAEILSRLLQRHEAGVVIAGSSAGLAVMSEKMMSGAEDVSVIHESEALKNTKGLGLISHAMVDSHFIVRQRLNRLFSSLLGGNASVGIGVDEDGAAEVTDDHELMVLGPSQVVIADLVAPRSFTVNVMRPGERYDLRSHALQ